jgi:multiple sugar transport system substrate-binding protein
MLSNRRNARRTTFAPSSRRTSIAIGITALAVLSLSSCGGAASSSESATAVAAAAGAVAASPTAASAAASLPSAAPSATGVPAVDAAAVCKDQTLNVLFPQPHQGASESLAKDFEAATGAKIVPTIVPYDEVATKVTLDAQSGANTYDVVDTFYINVGALAKDGVLADITDWINKTPDVNPSDFISAIYDPYSLQDGKRYGLPFDGDTHVLFYNEEILKRNGITAPPKTWDEYLADVKKITAAESKNGIYGAALLGQKSPVILGSSYANRLAGFGGAFIGADGKPALNTEAATQAAQALLDVAPYALPTPQETAFDQALPAFLNGKVAFIEFWTDLGTYSQDPKQSKIIDKWGVTSLPVGGSNTKPVAALDAGFVLGVTEASQKKDCALEFIKFASSSAENLKLITTTGSGIDPVRLSSLDAPEYKAFNPKVQAAAATALNGALAWPTVPAAPKLFQTLTDSLSGLLDGQGTPKDALQQVQDNWNAELGG